jgi:hypothetical protein
MRHGPENLSEQTLRSAAVPSLEADPKQKQELRRSLMQEWRKRFDQSAADHPGHHHPAWLPRLGIALGLGAMGLVIAFAYLHRSENRTPTAFDLRGRATTAASNQGFTAALGVAPNDSALNGDDASAVREAIARGYIELEQVITSKTHGRLYLYRVRLGPGREVPFASDRVLPADLLLGVQHAEDFQQAIERDQGESIGVGSSDIGAKLYHYRVRLPDTITEEYASDRDPDPTRRDQLQKELEQAMDQGKGDVYRTIAAPEGNVAVLLKVTLSDGSVRAYGRFEKPKGR